MAKSLLSLIEHRLSSEKPQKKLIWFDRLPQSIQRDLSAVRTKFQQGEYPNSKAQIANAIRDVVGNYIDKPSEGSVIRWLKR